MNRRGFLVGAGLAACGSLARAAPERIARIGFLVPTGRVPLIDSFVQGMRERGWVDGENLQIDFRFADNDESRLPALAVELVELRPQVIVTLGPAIIFAQRATSALPIVAAAAGDLVATGLAASLAHPGGNVTGEILFIAQYVGKRLELLKGVAPGLRRAAVLLYRGNLLNDDMMGAANNAARGLGIELQPVELAEVDEFEAAFSNTSVGGFVTSDHPLFAFNAEKLAAIALKRRLPWVGGVDEAAGGALMSYGADFREMLRHAAVFTDKILRGAKPGDILIEQVAKFRTIANLKTAAALGLEIPASLLAGADEVIE